MAGEDEGARPRVRGVEVDVESRCAHWRSERDIVAIRMACCDQWWACKACHEALADHPLAPWPASARDERAVLCGACGARLAIAAYLACADACPQCGAPFNPGCRTHRHFYFAP